MSSGIDLLCIVFFSASWGRQVGFLVAFASLALMLATPVAAQVKAGDFITPENGSKVKDLVSPGVYYKVQHGMTMKVECAAIGHSLKRRSVRNG